MKGMKDEIKIAYRYKVKHWKALRAKLLSDDSPNAKSWHQAFKIFKRRVETRFLKPIDSILGLELYRGEGFAAVALQCVLVEFFEAFYQGKIYSQPISDERIANQAAELGLDVKDLKEHLQPNEYKASAKLFTAFLRNHEPFKSAFTSNQLAGTFYKEIRCGLLHEAATKGASKIKQGIIN